MKVKEVKKYIKTAAIIGFSDWFIYLFANAGSEETAAFFTTLTFFYVFQDMKKESNKQLFRLFNPDPQKRNQFEEAQDKIIQIPPNIIEGGADAFDKISALLPKF